MINYPKIESLFKRDPKTNYATFLDEYSLPEFEYLKDCKWEWVEKIDGTNIKLYFEPQCHGICFKSMIEGRTEAAKIPTHLYEYLHNLTEELIMTGKCGKVFDCPVTLYGEGYGPKINNGHKYSKNVSFILFDIRIGHTWLKQKDIYEIGNKLDILVAPAIYQCTPGQAIEIVREGFTSCLAPGQDNPPPIESSPYVVYDHPPAEGLVGQPVVPMLTRMGKRIITKLKTKDFIT